MPCSNCGAPMQLVSGPYLYSSLGLMCGYCHRSEPLPVDAAERVRYLQARLSLLNTARQNDEAPLHTIEMIKRAWIPAILVLAVFTSLQVARSLSTLQALQKMDPELVYSFAMQLGIGLAVSLGYLSGYLGMLRGYRISVRPLLRARPPTSPGLSIRCRSCGGDLPNVNAPQIVCKYCTAPNLLDSDLTLRASELLQAEIAAYQARANHVYASEGFRAPTKAFYRWGGLGAVVGLLLGAAIGVTIASVSDSGSVRRSESHRIAPPAPSGRILR